METKRCPKCGEEKPISKFYRDRSRPQGYDSYCKECRDITNVEWKCAHGHRLPRLVPIESIERYPGEACYVAKARRLLRGEVVDPHCEGVE